MTPKRPLAGENPLGCRYFCAERAAISVGRHKLFVIASRVFRHQLDERVDGNGSPERKADNEKKSRHNYHCAPDAFPFHERVPRINSETSGGYAVDRRDGVDRAQKINDRKRKGGITVRQNSLHCREKVVTERQNPDSRYDAECAVG